MRNQYKFPKTSHKIRKNVTQNYQKPNGQKQYKPKTENNPAGRFAAGRPLRGRGAWFNNTKKYLKKNILKQRLKTNLQLI